MPVKINQQIKRKTLQNSLMRGVAVCQCHIVSPPNLMWQPLIKKEIINRTNVATYNYNKNNNNNNNSYIQKIKNITMYLISSIGLYIKVNLISCKWSTLSSISQKRHYLPHVFSKNQIQSSIQLYVHNKISRMSTIPEVFYQGPWYELEYTQGLYPQTSRFWLTVLYFPTWILFRQSAI